MLLKNIYKFSHIVEKEGIQVAERLAYIDFLLQFKGSFSRSDLTAFFGLKDAAVSNLVGKYREHRSKNVFYDRKAGKNVINVECFEPLVELDSETALGMLGNGFNKNKLQDSPIVPYERIGVSPKKLDVTLVSKISRAICNNSGVICCYRSGSSSNHAPRILFPTAIFFDGMSWMFRAYHRGDIAGANEFKCFDFARLQSVEESALVADIHERLEKDADWHITTPIHLELHPTLSESNKAATRIEFGIDDDSDELIINVKAVLFYFIAKYWRIDVSTEADNTHSYALQNYYKFHLKNRKTLEHLHCMENVFKGTK